MATAPDTVMSPFGALLGMEIVSAAAGTAQCRMYLKDQHRNNGGRIHGGVLAALADTTAGVAVRTVRPEGSQTATSDFTLVFIRPPLGEVLEAEARVIHAGRQVFRTEVSLHSQGKLVARASATFMLVAQPR